MEWYIYSSNSKITISDIKNWNRELVSDVDIDKIKNYMIDNNIFCLIKNQSNYHYKFETINSNPYLIYAIWDIWLLNQKILGMIWPRSPSQYAEKIMKNIFEDLKHCEVVTVSGLADGIDSLCHSRSVQSNIPTIAVLGWWIGWFLNSQNRHKIQKIIDAGWLILSEFKIFQEPTYYTFPQRNRIIAWLSDMLFLPEASSKSGSLITVDFAIQMNKKIFGVPNNIFEENSKWILSYMKSKKIEIIDDLSDFVFSNFKKKQPDQNNNISNTYSSLSSNWKIIYEIISSNFDWLAIENIFWIAKTKIQDMSLWSLNTEITMLELDWLVCQEKPWIYKKSY